MTKALLMQARVPKPSVPVQPQFPCAHTHLVINLKHTPCKFIQRHCPVLSVLTPIHALIGGVFRTMHISCTANIQVRAHTSMTNRVVGGW